MPLDSRRLQGPKSAFSYTLLEDKNSSETDEPGLSANFKKILLSSNQNRQDKRKPNDPRPLCIRERCML